MPTFSSFRTAEFVCEVVESFVPPGFAWGIRREILLNPSMGEHEGLGTAFFLDTPYQSKYDAVKYRTANN
jgi:hypothetical protein